MRAAITLSFLLAPTAYGQWVMQDAHTTASLRGIHAVGNGVAWASGTGGTVLRTEDGGYVWQLCAVPDADKDGARLDFRGVQGFDANTAIVMSSGKGDLSRLYKTTDGCQTWKLLLRNQTEAGFWDSVVFEDPRFGAVLGDPVRDHFVLLNTKDGGESWEDRSPTDVLVSALSQGAFAASNSSLLVWNGLIHRKFVSGGKEGSFLYQCDGLLGAGKDHWQSACTREKVPVGNASEASGAFSIAHSGKNFVIVGGDYLHPDVVSRTAAYSTFGEEWMAANRLPHGYRSAVAYAETAKMWITVGPNGTDVSFDDGRNWQPLKPGPEDASDADKNWNALSLPFVVGPKGRIGVLREDRLQAAKGQGAAKP